MKKLLTILMIFMALFAFIACENGNIGNDNSNVTVNSGNSNDGSNGGNGGNSGNSGNSDNTTFNPDKFAEEFADCTTDIESVVVSDGNWILNTFMTDTGTLAHATMQATAKDGNFTFTSGTQVQIVDVSKYYEEETEVLDAFKSAKTDEEKTAILIEEFGGVPEGGTVTWDELIATLTYTPDQETLEWTSGYFQFEIFPNTPAKCNAEKTKYVMTISYTSSIETYYLQKN